MRVWLLSAAAAATMAGCSATEQWQPHLDQPAGGSPLTLELTRTDAPVGARVGVRVRGTPSVALVGIDGELGFDPGALRYLGQPEPSAPFTIVNPAGSPAGRLRLLALDPAGLAAAGLLVFEVLRPDYAGTVRFQVLGAVSPTVTRLSGLAVGPPVPALVGRAEDLAGPRLLGLEDWLAWGRARKPASSDGPRPAPGDGLVYGDIDSDGLVTIFDAFGVANAAVGNFALTDVTKDYVVAANVFPFNEPGLGEPNDPLPPGVEADGSRVITLFDAAAISVDAVNCAAHPPGGCPPAQSGNQPVVGEAIPGRIAPTARVVVSGVIGANRAFTADTVYELHGLVKVAFGVTLTISPGTRIEGDSATRGALLVARGGRLVASGTLLQPIVFTCSRPDPGPGCWGGVIINGFALLNTPFTGPAFIPGCPERTAPGTTEPYGGCLIQDNSGTLRYVRIEHAGQPWPGLGSQPDLSLNGVGSGTVIEHLQVHGAAGDGLFVSGGRAELRRVLVTQAFGVGLRWDDGWQGKVQELIVFRTAGSGAALRGSNSEVDPNAGPRSAPMLFQVSLLEADGGSGPTAPALLFERGSAGVVKGFIVQGWRGVGLDIQGPESCARAADSLDVAVGVMWGNNADFATDPDCVDEVAYGASPLRDILLSDPEIRDLVSTRAPDFRPRVGSVASTGVDPPGDGFFNPAFEHRGGAPPATANGNVVAWFMGWTRGH